MEQYPFVSIIIPVRNVEKIIGKCLNSLKGLDYPKNRYEVIIADSESTDQTPEIVRQNGVTYISTPKKSVCAGRNAGFKISKGEIVAFSDADCVADKNWIKNSIKYFADSTVGAVGGPNITPPNESNFARAVAFVFNQAIFSAGSIYGRVLNLKKEVVSLPGCNMIFRREALQKVFPIDETIFGGEDFATNQLLRAQGYKLFYTPDTFVLHYHRTTPRKFFKQMFRYGISRLILGKKNRQWMNTMHITVGFGIPLILILALVLILINPLWLLCLMALGTMFLIIYFFLAWVTLNSLNAALLVPYVIILLFLSWSLGFIKEIIMPIKESSERTSASQTA